MDCFGKILLNINFFKNKVLPVATGNLNGSGHYKQKPIQQQFWIEFAAEFKSN